MARVNKKLQKIQKEITKRHLNQKPISAQLNQCLSHLQQEYQFIQTGLDTYRKHIHQISTLVHPFVIHENKIQNGTNIALKMRELLPKIKVLGEMYQLNSTEKALSQFQAQIDGIAIGIDLWWQNVTKSLFLEKVDSLTQNWILTCLLPDVYWSNLVSKTKNRDLKEIYQKSWFQAHQKLLKDPFTQKMNQKEINQWRDWSNLMVSKFQRASSAIEGRNGYLSRLHRGWTWIIREGFTSVNSYS